MREFQFFESIIEKTYFNRNFMCFDYDQVRWPVVVTKETLYVY
jgi:hypothetical protein